MSETKDLNDPLVLAAMDSHEKAAVEVGYLWNAIDNAAETIESLKAELSILRAAYEQDKAHWQVVGEERDRLKTEIQERERLLTRYLNL